MSANGKTWQPTRHRHIYKHRSGNYYVRIGNRTWKSLKTKLLSVALSKRDEVMRQERLREEVTPETTIEKMETIGDALAVRRSRIENDTGTKASTHKFWGHIFDVIPTIWPELPKRKIASLKNDECEAWASKYSESVSASHFNHVLMALRSSLEITVEAGLRLTNPFAKIKRKKAIGKNLTGKLPSKEQFAELVAEIRRSPSRWAEGCGDLVEFLAYSGVRIGEAKWIRWVDVDMARGEIVVAGDPSEGTKNRDIRRVPIISNMEDLLKRIAVRRGKRDAESPVLEVFKAGESMKSAADRLKVEPLTHHDLRHLFATTCIESGVDIPTVSKWLGHKDGGALAMKVYGHLRNEHSLAAAKKVSFS